jgi:hypothetical protein
LPPIPETDRVARKVFFYRIRTRPTDDGDVPIFQPRDAADCITALTFDTGDRYQDLGESGIYCVWPNSRGEFVRMTIGVVRRSGLPSLEALGDVTPLELAEEQGLLEQTHVVFFPDGVVGAEFNFYGPRVSRLATYIADKCADVPLIRFDMLLNQDAEEQLANLEDIRLVELRLRRSDIALLEDADEDLAAALEATAERVDAPVVDITLRPEPHSRRPLGQGAFDLVRRLVGEPTTRERFEKFQVRGLDNRTEKPEAFDLLQDRLMSTRRVIRQDTRYRAVNSDDMYREIESAYRELRDSLERAAGIG